MKGPLRSQEANRFTINVVVSKAFTFLKDTFCLDNCGLEIFTENSTEHAMVRKVDILYNIRVQSSCY